MKHLVIIGAGMATGRLLTELVSHQHNFSIDVISEESVACYNRILLSSLLAGEKSNEDISLLNPEFFRKNSIHLHTDEKVTQVDVSNKEIRTDKHRSLIYDVLVIATGSVPFIPPIEGIKGRNVFTFRNLDDLGNIREFARHGSHATVVGGGLLGLEAAYGLSKLGMRCSVINREEWLMPRQLSSAAAAVLQARMESQGIGFHLGIVPQRIDLRNDLATSVSLSSDEEIATDLILIAAGITPNADLAREAGLDCQRGILIDELMQSSVPGIYALGECAQLNEQLFGLVPPVYDQAKLLAANLCTNSKLQYRHADIPTQLKISGIEVVSAGQLDSSTSFAASEQVMVDSRQGIYRRIIFENQQLIGYELIGDRLNSAGYSELLKSAAKLENGLPDTMFEINKTSNQNRLTIAGE